MRPTAHVGDKSPVSAFVHRQKTAGVRPAARNADGGRVVEPMGNDAERVAALLAAEQQLLNAAGAARIAARRIGGERDLAPLREEVLAALRTLEQAAHRLRERRRSRWSTAGAA